ncbi:hypothetical protein PR048_021530 [Dryococelus australis]|uniref:Uncharacterized protein n=1 Tax=Dryococelus australis TaxID=614101 RepID=A0ABQ9GYF6_9NEOP|nr:hypothetical protein PR048_021530 [Dryococelus australis]
MTIEKTLTHSMKSTGGLTQGRGITESILSKTIPGTTATHDICTSLEEFSDVHFSSTEQHVDFRGARQKRDTAGVAKLTQWLENHPPFPSTQEIMSLETGVVGDSNIDCYNAISVGKRAIAEVVGKHISDVKLSWRNKALPLACVNNPTTINNDALLLAQFLLALFNEVGMHKTKKSVLNDLFTTSEKDMNFENALWLMSHMVKKVPLFPRFAWDKSDTSSNILAQIVQWFSIATQIQLTVEKNAEQNRRYNAKTSVDIHLGDDTLVTIKQDHLLSKDKNKSWLISMLSAKPKDNGIEFTESSGDANTLIVSKAIEKCFMSDNVAIVGEYVDMLFLLTVLAPTEREIFLDKNERKVFSSKQLQESGLKNSILVLHVLSGCDTTSAIYKRGKTKCKIFKQCQDLHVISAVFINNNSTRVAIAEAGTRIKETSLNLHRYNSFTKSMTNNKPGISSLPLTAGAPKQHSFCVYHQVHQCIGKELPPELWGWKCVHNRLVPTTTGDAVASEGVLNLIFCRCTTG